MTDLTSEGLDVIDASIRRGLGPEQGLMDLVIAGEEVRELLDLPAGRAIVSDCVKRAVGALDQLVGDAVLTPERDRELVLAVKTNISILRRMAAIVAAGKMAVAAIDARLAQPAEGDANE